MDTPVKLNGPTLREYTETRFNLLIEQLKNMGCRFDEKIKEADIRYEQRFNAQMEATSKADVASEKRFENVNEFRKTLTDQTATFVPRTEFSQAFTAITDRLSKLESVLAAREARISGALETKTDSRSDLGMWISVVMMMVGLIALAITFMRR